LRSFDPELLIEPAERLLGSVELAPLELGLELGLLLAPPIFALFSTKPPPAPVLLDGLLAGLLELLLSRCRQPVAVTCPAISLDERPVGWLLCGLELGGLVGLELGGLLGGVLGGVEDGGVCAARVPQSATALHSVVAHCH
jgi:hypothetical protein